MTTKNYSAPAPTPSESPISEVWIAELLDRLRAIVGDEEFVPLHRPEIGAVERELVIDCIDSGWVSSVGRYVDQFEQQLAESTGAAHAVAVVNGTAALHVCLVLAGVQPGDEVLCPSLSFIATANAISYCGAVPHFVDIEQRTMGMDPEKLRSHLRDIVDGSEGETRNRTTGRRIAAVVPMHTFGHPVDLDMLIDVADEFQLPVIEDAAESLGSYYRDRHTGTFGRLNAVSFNGNKIMTTGGGGAILTNDSGLAARAKHLTTTAKRPHRWAYHHDAIGFNYRMPNLNAALGCGQLSRLESMRSRKRKLAQRYRDALAGCEHVQWVDEPSNCRSNFWLNAMLTDGLAARDAVLAATNDAGVMTRPLWDLLSRLPMYEACPAMDLQVSQWFWERVVCLPSSAGLVSESDHG